jgi:hypothetical protein
MKGTTMNNFWDFLWLIFWSYILISVIMILIQIFTDLFRDRTLNGWMKALWVIFLVFLPFLGALVYLITRGRQMGKRYAERAMQTRAETDEYIRATAGSNSSPTEEITQAKSLLESGAITQAEFDTVKARALA